MFLAFLDKHRLTQGKGAYFGSPCPSAKGMVERKYRVLRSLSLAHSNGAGNWHL